MTAAKPQLTRHPDGITAVDTEYVRPQQDAAHIVMHQGHAAIVDTGANNAVPLLLAALAELGIAREAVEYLFLTHVHLDHAGGAGQLMRALPRAKAVLHPRGAPHMVDPSKLIAGTISVYGQQAYQQLYGEVLPIAAERIVITRDGQRLALGEREFEFIHTPGHALHHQSIVDHGARSIFSGDTFGISYRQFDNENGAWILPTTTPTQFDPEQLTASIDRMLSYEPQAIYLTHYSRVTDCERLATTLKQAVADYARVARESAAAADASSAIYAQVRALAHRSLAAHGCKLPTTTIDELLGGDYRLNTDGLIAWLTRRP
jgi:glyoxylase-like metal-dependent hydrolase (beta-lactamase superfamily II)